MNEITLDKQIEMFEAALAARIIKCNGKSKLEALLEHQPIVEKLTVLYEAAVTKFARPDPDPFPENPVNLADALWRQTILSQFLKAGFEHEAVLKLFEK